MSLLKGPLTAYTGVHLQFEIVPSIVPNQLVISEILTMARVAITVSDHHQEREGLKQKNLTSNPQSSELSTKLSILNPQP